ncbi:hypothetical protein [Streptomyces sp. NPDC093589]|uniref:hypothetical protein n=1 Tax=Streptomyces sp. NPDC093589 TaxID=3366043 RepID=UPI0038169D1F
MTTHIQPQTITDPDALAAGRADAYDEHRTPGTDIDTLIQRLDAMTRHLGDVNDAYTAYVLGYSAYVTETRIEANALRRIADEDYVEHLANQL